MSLDQNINNELKDAMLSKNEVKLRTIKAIKAAFLIAKTKEPQEKSLQSRKLKYCKNCSISAKNLLIPPKPSRISHSRERRNGCHCFIFTKTNEQ